MDQPLPSYDQLPVSPGAPPGSSWGLWGADDVLGCLNLLTPERALAGARCVQSGRAFNLNLELELPEPPLYGRPAFEHVVVDRRSGHDDLLSSFNTQSSSQWDGFRHIRHQAYGFYNGVADEDHGVHHWVRHGLVGRAVLADVARWRHAEGRPLVVDRSDPITADDLASTLAAQGSELEVGDVLLVRTGWMAWYRSLGPADRAELASSDISATGLAAGRAMAAFLWDHHVAAVAADNPALECWPPPLAALDKPARRAAEVHPSEAVETFLHAGLLPLLGVPIGELFDLDALAQDCADDGRYEALFTSAPLNLAAGVASPPNALAVK